MNTSPWSTIGQGATWLPVKSIQYFLRARGHVIAADGVYGPATAAAVTSFQSSAGLTADGIVGPQTWPHLIITTASGSTGDAVRAVQQFGHVRFFNDPPLVVDGDYGPETTTRMKFFQESWGLTIDGITGPETWSFLSALVPPPGDVWPLVKVGATQATNWRVLAAQHLLRAHGATIAADGVFGPLSGAAVTAFQQSIRGDEISTTIGQRDWPSLILTVQQGSSGEAVKALQSFFGSLVPDGAFGPLTKAAVLDFQQKFAQPADGIVGPKTWWALTQRIFD